MKGDVPREIYSSQGTEDRQGGAGPLSKAHRCLLERPEEGQGEEHTGRAMLGSWAQQRLLFCPFLSQHLFACDTWQRASEWESQRHGASPPWKHDDFSASSNTPARAPHASLSSLLPPPGSQETLQNVLLILRAALVGVRAGFIVPFCRWPDGIPERHANLT